MKLIWEITRFFLVILGIVAFVILAAAGAAVIIIGLLCLKAFLEIAEFVIMTTRRVFNPKKI